MPKKPKGKPDQALVHVPAAVPAATPSAAPVREKHAGGRETLLTPELQQRTISYIRAGAFDWVAAEANGVGRFIFWEWIKRGEDTHSVRPPTEQYAQFAQAVREARAEARLSAEVEVKRGEPLSWLMKGPGRDRSGEPGWASPSDTHQVEAAQSSGPTWAQWAALRTQLLAILLKYPDVHQAAAQVFQQVVIRARERNGDTDPTP